MRSEGGRIVFVRRLRHGVFRIHNRWKSCLVAGARADRHDLRSRKARKHALHQGISLNAALELGLASLHLLLHRRRALFGRERHHPASVGQFAELAREIAARGVLDLDDIGAGQRQVETYVGVRSFEAAQLAYTGSSAPRFFSTRLVLAA